MSFNEYTNPHIYLGFRSKDYNIYQDELERSCNSYKFVKSYYETEDGIIDIQSIFNENGPSSNYFISGPPVMIKAFKSALVEKGVPLSKILTDDWE